MKWQGVGGRGVWDGVKGNYFVSVNVTVVCSSTTINITCGECSKIALFKTVREISM